MVWMFRNKSEWSGEGASANHPLIPADKRERKRVQMVQ